MSYQQTKKVTDIEKRLQAIRRELYGKEKPVYLAPKLKQTSETMVNANITVHSSASKTDVYYLNRDLKKILFLATIAISAQILLYLQINNHLFKFN